MYGIKSILTNNSWAADTAPNNHRMDAQEIQSTLTNNSWASHNLQQQNHRLDLIHIIPATIAVTHNIRIQNQHDTTEEEAQPALPPAPQRAGGRSETSQPLLDFPSREPLEKEENCLRARPTPPTTTIILAGIARNPIKQNDISVTTTIHLQLISCKFKKSEIYYFVDSIHRRGKLWNSLDYTVCLRCVY